MKIQDFGFGTRIHEATRQSFYLSALRLLIIVAVALAVVVSRRPDALLNPQFYAEDGAVWFADAWNLGWVRSLALPDGGYLNTFPRLVSGLALLFPVTTAPLILNLFGMAAQVLPVLVLLSERCVAWGGIGIRLMMAVLYLALPNSSEIDVTATNAHWHLALVACLITFAESPAGPGWIIFDIVILLLTGLTGPWSIVLTPLVLVFWWFRRRAWSLVVAGIVGSCAAVQALELLTHPDRPSTPLGATIPLLLRLVGGHVFLGAIWGQNSFAKHGAILPSLILVCLGCSVLAYGVLKLPLEGRLFCCFAFLIAVAELRSPLIAGPKPRWFLLADDQGARYWFFPMLAFLWSLVSAALQRRHRLFHWMSLCCLLLMMRGIVHDWRYRAYQNIELASQLKKFERSAPGTTFVISIVPPGTTMKLLKK